MKQDTLLAIAGLADERFDGVVNMPVCRASTILFKNLEDFEAGERGEYKLPTYGRYGNPTQLALEAALAELEGADHAMVVSSGLAAITAALFAFLKSGDHVLVSDNVYGPGRRVCDYELKRFGVEVTYFDPSIGAGVEALIQPNTKLLYIESPGSLTFEVQDIPAMAKVAHKHDIVVFADNTWATPLGLRPFELGIDVSMHSATKYISGHSDMLMGVLSCKESHYKPLIHTVRHFGACPAADNCALALRGLRTMGVRLRHHQQSALHMAEWLKARPEVTQVFYPALPGAPGHEIWKRDFSKACGLFAFQMKALPHEKLREFIDGLDYFGLGWSWGGFESLIIPVTLGKQRSATEWKHEGALIRVHIGLEDVEDLKADLAKAFARAYA